MFTSYLSAAVMTRLAAAADGGADDKDAPKAASGIIDTSAINNFLLQLVVVVCIVVGLGMLFGAKRIKLADNIGTLGNVLIAFCVMGLGTYVALGTNILDTVLA